MKLFTTAKDIINIAFNYVILTSKKYDIDESHALKHSMDVFNYANKIYESEVKTNFFLEEQKTVIQVSAILHDMCDKKYMDESEGIKNVNSLMQNFMPEEDLTAVSNIISTMSYSKVKNVGYPTLDKYQLAYHIVREADLLAAYDVDRTIIYQMMHKNYDYVESIQEAITLFENRILKYRKDKLFITNFSKNKSLILHRHAEKKIEYFKGLQSSF